MPYDVCLHQLGYLWFFSVWWILAVSISSTLHGYTVFPAYMYGIHALNVGILDILHVAVCICVGCCTNSHVSMVCMQLMIECLIYSVWQCVLVSAVVRTRRTQGDLVHVEPFF